MTTPARDTATEPAEATAGRRLSLLSGDWSRGGDQVGANLHQTAQLMADAAHALAVDAANRATRR